MCVCARTRVCVDENFTLNMFDCNLGVVGTALTYSCTPEVMRRINNLGQTKLGSGVKVEQGFGLELLFTFILVFHVLAITDPINKTEKYGTCLGIGVVILVCHVCLVSKYILYFIFMYFLLYFLFLTRVLSLLIYAYFIDLFIT